MSAASSRIGVCVERQSGFAAELSEAAIAVAHENGWPVRRVESGEDEARVDIALAIGNVGLFPDLVSRPKRARRVLWHGETLPRHTPESGSRLHELAPTGRLLDLAARWWPAIERSARYVRLREQASMVREPLANLRALGRRRAAFDRIVIDAVDRAEGALDAGIPVHVVPFGYHASYAGPLLNSGGRPIDALALAHLVGRYGRRQRALAAIGAELAGRAVAIEHVTAGMYGAGRRRILEQTRVVVDVHRVPGNHPGFRFLVATAAGAVVVTEPLVSPWPLVPDVHYVEAHVDEMAAAVSALLADEGRRQQIVSSAQRLIATDLSMARVLPKALGIGSP